jgi:Rrf2 family protein
MEIMLSQTSRYALRALDFMANQGNGDYKLVKDISGKLDIPQQYLSKILHSLAREGLLQSQRGRSGGFRLNRPAAEITLFDVVDPLDHLSRLGTCIMGDRPCGNGTSQPCALHGMWGDVRGKYLTFLRSTTLAELKITH